MMNLSPRIPGHEMIGRVEAVGENVTKWKKGDRVGGAWHGGHCFDCDGCETGYYQVCRKEAINGVTQDGGCTLHHYLLVLRRATHIYICLDAEYALLRSEAVVRIPESGDAAELAPLLCAGVTVYNGMRQLKLPSGSLVAVSGLGGLGHLVPFFVYYAKNVRNTHAGCRRCSTRAKWATKWLLCRVAQTRRILHTSWARRSTLTRKRRMSMLPCKSWVAPRWSSPPRPTLMPFLAWWAVLRHSANYSSSRVTDFETFHLC